VLVLREVLARPASEVAETLDTSVASVNSALQRARRTMDGRLDPVSPQATLRALGDEAQRGLVHALVSAWERSDVDGVVGLLAEDARFTMPPLPAWFDGRAAVRRFFAERVFENPWRLVPMTANGQLAVACYMGDPAGTTFPLSGVTVLTLRGHEIVAMDSFLAPEALGPFGLPPEAPR
jgi:RNA polymerase sigma-70 factor (ECF subfamily)